MRRSKIIAIFTNFVLFVIVSTGLPIHAKAQGKTRGKTRPRPAATSSASAAASKVPVIVSFKDGNHVTGQFLRADAETIEVMVGSKKMSLKTSEVFSMVFETDDEPPSNSVENVVKNLQSNQDSSDPTVPLARKAYTSLSRLAEAIELRVPYSQYSAQLFDAKAVVDDATAALPEGAVKIDLNHALEVFTDAARAWGAVQQQYGPYAGRIPIKSEPGSTLMRKYNIKPEVNAVGDADHLKIDTALKTILAAAKPILKNLDFIIGQP